MQTLKKIPHCKINQQKIVPRQLFLNLSIYLAKRGTPRMSQYKHAIQLYKLHNSTSMTDDWVSLNTQQYFNGRNNKFQVFNMSNYKVGRNLLVNRFKSLNNKIDYLWFNESFNSFKIKCKTLFLQ